MCYFIMMKKIIVLSDTHCGHRTGLTPPDYWDNPESDFKYYHDIQKKMWEWFSNKIDSIRPDTGFDGLFFAGDAIDGNAKINSGIELITSDRNTQISIAEEIINFINAKKNVIIAGSAYHTGKEEDFEQILADKTGAHFGSHEFVDVDGIIFDLKHKIGGSSIPHGRHTAIAKESLWNVLSAERGIHPRANVFIRGHVHYFGYCGDAHDLRITLPALEWSTHFGARNCSGTIDIGFIEFNIENGNYTWQPHILKLDIFKQEPIKI